MILDVSAGRIWLPAHLRERFLKVARCVRASCPQSGRSQETFSVIRRHGGRVVATLDASKGGGARGGRRSTPGSSRGRFSPRPNKWGRFPGVVDAAQIGRLRAKFLRRTYSVNRRKCCRAVKSLDAPGGGRRRGGGATLDISRAASAPRRLLRPQTPVCPGWPPYIAGDKIILARRIKGVSK